MIAPRLVCGLGNRLFQTVAAIRLADLYRREPVFFLPRMGRGEHGNFETLLTLFPKIKIVETAPSWSEAAENDDGTLPTVDSSSLIVLSGFFQNTENFPSLPNKYLPQLPSPLPLTNRWAVHFRLGDYQILPHYHIGLSCYYYRTITEKIPSKSTICLFSDSPEKLPPIAKEIEDLGYKVEIYENDDLIETFREFASCSSGSVCSNSTFCWWAAYFAWKEAGPHYNAYFPDRWIMNHITRVFTLPFTQTIKIDEIPAFPRLNSFSL